MATSLFTNISDQLIRGSIRIKVLNHILAKKDIFTELVKIGKCRPAIFLSTDITYDCKVVAFLGPLIKPDFELAYLFFPTHQTVSVKMSNVKIPIP